MTNGNPYKSFFDYLCEKNEIKYVQRNCLHHANDLALKDILLDLKFMNREHVNYLWNKYQIEKRK